MKISLSQKTTDFMETVNFVAVMFCSFRQGCSLLRTHMLRPFYDRLIALTQEERSLVNDMFECVRD